MKEQIANYFNRYVAFEAREIDEFYQHLTTKIFKRKTYLVQEGDICKHYFFVTKGLLRSFYFDDKGNEKITQFAIENWWVTHLESFVLGSRSSVNIQAIENTTVLMINKSDLDTLYSKIPKLERLFRLITEKMLIAIQRKNEWYMHMNSIERYKQISSSIPHFMQRVPQYMIASYLEITPEYLSEIRKNCALGS
ncbi:MAG: Crp/Fnr family transcriptional regulator [Bacteroidota bacterium]